MEINIKQAGAPSIPSEITKELETMEPKVFMRWQPRHRKADNYSKGEDGPWSARWEIWCELKDSAHPDAANTLARADKWNTDHQCWMRKLMVYQTEDCKYAPADRLLIIGLEMADAWANRRFYEDHIEDPYEAEEDARSHVAKELGIAGVAYYDNFNNPTVGAHGSGGNWRWRHR